MTSDFTVADPRPEEMCDPFEGYWNSSPRNLIEVMSQLLPLTVNTNALLEPASTMWLSPLRVTPKAEEMVNDKTINNHV
jgi:hypothetical protein